MTLLKIPSHLIYRRFRVSRYTASFHLDRCRWTDDLKQLSINFLASYLPDWRRHFSARDRHRSLFCLPNTFRTDHCRRCIPPLPLRAEQNTPRAIISKSVPLEPHLRTVICVNYRRTKSSAQHLQYYPTAKAAHFSYKQSAHWKHTTVSNVRIILLLFLFISFLISYAYEYLAIPLPAQDAAIFSTKRIRMVATCARVASSFGWSVVVV